VAAAIDLTGQRFGRLVAIRRHGTVNHGASWLCRCDCGCEHVVRAVSLRRGDTKSCGCQRWQYQPAEDLVGRVFGRLTVERYAGGGRWFCNCSCGKSVATPTSHSLLNGSSSSCGCLRIDLITKHGQSYHPLYHTWCGMLARCSNPNNKSYPDYGGRGIAICDRRLDIENFITDMGQRPSGLHSVHRINNDGPYAPGNCKWALGDEQSSKGNKRTPIANRRGIDISALTPEGQQAVRELVESLRQKERAA
jgi:hypothetical protein